MFVSMLAMKDVRLSHSGPEGLLGTCGELVAVGQVVIATSHGGWQIARTGGKGILIGGRPLGRQ